jgi:hypothetical protein
MEKMRTALLAVIAVALLGILVTQMTEGPATVSVEPCVVVVNPTRAVSAEGYPVADPYVPPSDGC